MTIVRTMGKPMQPGRTKPASPAIRLACLALLCLLNACETTDFSRTGGVQTEARAEQMARTGQHDAAAAFYIDLATRASGIERDRLTLLAAEQWLDAGDGRRAASAMSSVAKPAEGEMLWLWTTNSSALALWQGKPDDALQLLEPVSRQALPLQYRSRVEALRADAWFQKDEPARAVQLFMQRETWLDDSDLIEQNRERLWAGLRVSDPQVLRAQAEHVADPVVKGWLTLGVIATSTGQQGIGWSNGVVRWQGSHEDHPGNSILDGLSLMDDRRLDYPRQIALLLPLSGENAAAGEAIQNGFLGAYFAQAAGLAAGLDSGAVPLDESAPDPSPGDPGLPIASMDEQRVRVYDVNVGGAPEAYARAVADGAEFVVGPLLRPGVTALANEAMLPVPVLTLNYLADDAIAPPGLYQFALAPEDEAISAAAKAADDGYSRAVAIVPNNDWGRRVLSSFATEFESRGGVMLDYRSYQSSTQDFSIEIEGLMALHESVQRYERLRANIGGPLQFDPRRRQDAEFIFLGADSKAGRLIKSQLKFHYAGDLPVYSTSFIYSMDGRSDSDLNGIMFADTPWIISPHAWLEELPALYNKYWPAEKRLGRLHAMGYDAYHLVAELFSARTEPMREFVGATGRLYLDDDGRIHRRLAWAQFVSGEPVGIPDTYNLDRSLPELDEEAADEWRQPSPNP
ncbi:MAG TPA: penicillin-binding protein activator [Woeseiaceae bacterium]|nr:penicillin-binding protein activator [Woeseiaceae bacterium]